MVMIFGEVSSGIDTGNVATSAMRVAKRVAVNQVVSEVQSREVINHGVSAAGKRHPLGGSDAHETGLPFSESTYLEVKRR